MVIQDHDRSIAWRKRTAFSQYGVPLGFGAEYWDLKADHYEGASAVRQRLTALGRRETKRGIALRLARSLLEDVLVAAGGVEQAVGRLRRAATELKTLAEKWNVRGDTTLKRHGLADFGSIDAAYAFAELLSWVRAFDERLDRRAYEKGIRRRQGLLPAIRPKRLTTRVERSVNKFRAGPGGDCRNLANFTLHASLVREPMSGVEVDETGDVRLPIPDTPTGPVYHWDQLTWADDRDGFAFAEDVWMAVQEAVEELLDAFERAVPKRFRNRS